jgi:uncharacterized protein
VDVLVTGSSGFIGTALLSVLERSGHRPVRLVRGAAGTDTGAGAGSGATVRWDPAAGTIDAAGLEGIGAVVHLAGESIGARKWTAEQKQRILESRTRGTTLLSETLARLQTPPAVLVSASAVGYYGNRGAEELTEESGPGDGFLVDVCRAWESSTTPATDAGIRVACVRTGIALSSRGGALQRMLLPFKLGLGGRIGSGTQYMSWISLPDEVRAILHVLEHDSIAGPVNLTGPSPVTNTEFTETLGAVLHRPTVLPTPLLPLQLRYGKELVRQLLVEGQRVLPAKLLADGFRFEHPTLETALRAVLATPAAA